MATLRAQAHPLAGYWLRPSELWARACSQWLAERSGDRALVASVRRLARSSDYQWDEADFEPIAEAIDRLLEASLGSEP